MITTTKTPLTYCPACGAPIEGATGEGDRKPSQGSIGVCWYCAEIMIYNQDMTLRKLTVKELLTLQRSSTWPFLEGLVRSTKERIAGERRCTGI